MVENFSQLKNNKPTHIYQETTLREAFDDFVRVSELIISIIENELFDKIPFNKRNQIWTTISSINQQLNQCKQYAFNFSNQNIINIANSIIQQTVNLIDFTETTNLYARSIGLENYKDEVKKLSDTRNKYQKIINEIDNLNSLSSDIQNTYKLTNAFKNDIENLKFDADNKVILIGDAKAEAEKVWNLLNETKEKIKSDEQEVENKKLGINSFSENIVEYKESIEELKSKANYLVEKKTEIDVIIEKAEKALNLNSAIGISAAFSSQYEAANNQAKFKIKNLEFNLWILGSIVFMLSAIGITIWIATGQLNTDTNGISLIVARIVAVAILITGATFCAKQFIKQRNIAEDYAYKAVLSKSIIAFADEIKNKNPDKVADYLTKVLEEIHKDPLRQRESKEDVSIGLNPTEIFKSLIDKIPGK